MTIDADIAKISEQERLLRFKSFSEQDAWELGTLMRQAAASRNLPLVIDVRIGNRPLFYTALPGTTPENPDWVRRKVNTVLRFHKSTYLLALEYQKSGKPFNEQRGILPLDYAAAGGGFPIHIVGTGVVGAVTVSGLPQRDDHNFVVEALAERLGVNTSSIALADTTGNA
jgi:uncharacterized protein (UPF0303 family)